MMHIYVKYMISCIINLSNINIFVIILYCLYVCVILC